ncbi:hypothetical protein [Actinomadura bangladeshensis]|uniref:Restriction endonuclease subunit S n=1 Tax=Actinomadura bangladeshensis TaxID=453573 RepID=A0A6L9QS36_9ACTN|nr:hypothetical protein [Actinomadura bangladeshensis]NEA28315.1 hypothetical protein [Actinomadura bangladeshensis]
MGAQSWSQAGELVAAAQRLDPEYFDPRVLRVAAAVDRCGSRPLRELVTGAWRGGTPDYDPDGKIKVVKTANVQRFELASEPAEYVGDKEDSDAMLIPRGSLLVTSTGVGSAGRSFVYFGREKLTADGHVTVMPLRCSDTDGAYICAYLQSPAGRQQVIRLHRGSSRQIEIYPDDLLGLQIPWPSGEARQAIGQQWLSAANAVEKSRSSVQSAEAAIEKFLGIKKDDIEAVREAPWEARSGSLSLGSRLDAEYLAPQINALRRSIVSMGGMKMSALIKQVTKGVQPDFYDPSGPILVVKSKDVNFPDFQLDKCERTFGIFSSYLRKGDVLVNMTGEGSLGRACAFPDLGDSEQDAVASVDVAVLQVNRADILPEYLALFLNSWMGRRQTTALQTGSSGQQHLYPAHFREIVIPLKYHDDGNADLRWQQDIVDIANERSRASTASADTGRALDGWFGNYINEHVDLGTIPY